MTWIFDYTIPSLIILLFFLIFYFLKPVLLSQANRIFFSLIVVEILGFFITNYSCYTDNNSENYSRLFLIFLNNIYFIIIIARYLFVSLFFASLFNVRIKKDAPTILSFIIIACVVVLILTNPCTKIIYLLTSKGKYVRSKGFFVVYIVNCITLILDLYYVIRFRKKLDFKGKISSVFAILALFACSLLDIFYLKYLLTDMFFLFTILILFLAFENPDIFLDKKTGVYNKQTFTYLTQEYLLKKQKKYACTFFIIKNYSEKKQIYGTKQMDIALLEIAKFLSSVFHTSKCFYLQKGSFATVKNNKIDSSKFYEVIKKRFEKPWIMNNSELHLDIIIIDMDNKLSFESVEDIINSYEIALSDVKEVSNNRITINKELFDKTKRRTKVTKALNKALLEDNLQVYMQPIVDSSTRKIIAAEALVRIYDEDLGIISPDEFITKAEKNGSIEQLGEQVLNKVCVFLKESNINKYGVRWINVNLSPIQCQNKKLPVKIDNIADINAIDHKYIHLEITEDSIIDAKILKNQMNLLISDGYNFSLDDFGSGFSNITRVKKFPFNNIKLDMSIVRDHFKEPDNMLPNIVKTFTERGLSVTAEGVETKEMADVLENMGCKFLQGYYFSKPITVEEFKKLVSEKNV